MFVAALSAITQILDVLVKKKKNLAEEAKKAEELRLRAEPLIRGAQVEQLQELVNEVDELKKKAAEKTQTKAWDLAIVIAKRNPVLGVIFGAMALYPIVAGIAAGAPPLYILGFYVILVVAVTFSILTLGPHEAAGESVRDEYSAAEKVLLHYDRDCKLKSYPDNEPLKRGYKVMLSDPSGADLMFYVSYDGRIMGPI